MKLSLTIVLLSVASYAFAQSPKDSRSTKIDENEKKRLENQFKALDNFYINDDGLVVYQTQSDSTTQTKSGSPADTIQSNTSTSKSVKTEDKNQHLTNEESANTNSKSTSTEKPLSTHVTSSTGTEAATPPQASIIRKEPSKPTEATTSSSTGVSETGQQKTEAKSTTVINSPITNQDTKNNVAKTNTTSTTSTKVSSTSPTKTGAATSTTSKSSIFNKNRQPSQYKTMEEAALAVEALLDDLRKEQTQTTGAGSMSSRLAGGAGRATLRKKPATTGSTYLNDNPSDYVPKNTSTTIVDESTSEFGPEPTYYINGKEVDKTEINKLRKKEIISREVRTRNTVSGNPNGEVWYEVKYDTTN